MSHRRLLLSICLLAGFAEGMSKELCSACRPATSGEARRRWLHL
jgi:hypothetical protein